MNFHSQSSDTFSSIFSHKNIPGILLANGNKGKNLIMELNEIKSFISLDLGETWKKLSDESNVYACSSSGNFVVYIKENQSTKFLHLSMDHGNSFRKIPLTEEQINVLEIKNF